MTSEDSIESHFLTNQSEDLVQPIRCKRKPSREMVWAFSRAPVRFSRAWRLLHVFPRLALVACFPAPATGYMFSGAWHKSHVFPRLALVTCFPALGTSHLFSRPWHLSHVFPALGTWFLGPTTCFDSSSFWLILWMWRLALRTLCFSFKETNFTFLHLPITNWNMFKASLSFYFFPEKIIPNHVFTLLLNGPANSE